MTGFARSEGSLSGRTWIWETRSVNGRSLDVRARVPSGFDALEALVRDAAQKRFKRGSLQATLTVARITGDDTTVRVDIAAVERLLAAGSPFIGAGRVAPARWDGLLQVRGVVTIEEAGASDDEALRAAIVADLDIAFDRLAAARAQEGATLAALLGGLLDRMAVLVAEAEALAQDVPSTLARKLRERVESLSDVVIDPTRLAQEAALLASKADVREELDRLRAHVTEAHALLLGADAVGRRLDFLCQELSREANTVCSKSADLALTRIGIDLKTAIDQFKEQSANVE
jgi:uncharacterized protein (TIGR00255 family)